MAWEVAMRQAVALARKTERRWYVRAYRSSYGGWLYGCYSDPRPNIEPWRREGVKR